MTDEPEAEATDTAAGDDSEAETAETEATEAETEAESGDEVETETETETEVEAETTDDTAEEPAPAVDESPSDDEATTVPPAPVPPVAAAAAIGAPLTTVGRRFGAFVLDVLLGIVLLGIGWLIWSLVVWSKGQSPGKKLLGIRVVKADTGQAANWGTMALREVVGKWLLGSVTGSITTIVSAFMILLTDERQGIWDKIAGTIVVDDPEDQLAA